MKKTQEAIKSSRTRFLKCYLLSDIVYRNGGVVIALFCISCIFCSVVVEQGELSHNDLIIFLSNRVSENVFLIGRTNTSLDESTSDCEARLHRVF